MRVKNMGKTFFLCAACLLSGLCLVLTSVGCGGSGNAPKPQPAKADPQAMFEDWKKLVDFPAVNKDNPQYLVLANQIARADPSLVGKMLETAVEPNRSPESRNMALSSLNGLLPPELSPRLIELSQPPQDSATRAAAAILLAPIKTPEVTKQLQALAADADKRVAFAGTVGLVIQGDAEARKTLRDMYTGAKLPPQYRERVVITLTEQMTKEDLPVLCAAVNDRELGSAVTNKVINALVVFADPDAVPALQQCAGSDAPQNLKDLARDAALAIQNRINAPSPPQASSPATTTSATPESPTAPAPSTPAPTPAPPAAAPAK